MNQDGQISLQPQLPVAKTCDHVFITSMRATDVAKSLRRLPIGFYATVAFDGRTVQTSCKAAVTDQDAVEWDEEIVLPSDQSSSILFSVYASFGLGPTFRSGELLYQSQITVGEVRWSQQLESIKSTAQDDILPSRSSLRITTEQRSCHANGSCPALPPPRTPNALEELMDKGHRALLHYRQQQDQTYLDTAIQIFRRAQDICPMDNPSRSAVLFQLANAKLIDCQANNRSGDLDVPIGLYQDALQLNSDVPDHYTMALELGYALLARFQRRGVEMDRVEAMGLLKGVVEASAPNSHAYRAGNFALRMAEAPSKAGDARLSQVRHVSCDDPAQKVVLVLRDSSYWNPHRSPLLAALGVSLRGRFVRDGALADIHEAIAALEHARNHILRDPLEIPSILSDLGDALSCRFDRLGDLVDRNRSISVFERAINLTSDGHPEKPDRLKKFGISLRRHFERCGDVASLNRSILVLEEAANLTLDNDPSILDGLGNSLAYRFGRLGDLADLNRFISVTEEAVCLTQDGDPGKGERLNNLGTSLWTRFKRFADVADLNKSICLREEALRLIPDGDPQKSSILVNLGTSLQTRFKYLGNIVDLNRSILILEEDVRVMPQYRPSKVVGLAALGNSFFHRFELFGDPMDLNRSIAMHREAVFLTPDGHPYKPYHLNNLGNSMLCRFKHLEDLADLNESIRLREEAICLASNDNPFKRMCLNNLGCSLDHRFKRLGDPADLNKSISVAEEANSLTPDGHSEKPDSLSNLGKALLRRCFERLGNVADLNRSVSLLEEAVSVTPDGHSCKPELLISLGKAFTERFKNANDPADLFAASSHFSIACRSTTGPTDTRFGGALCWIYSLQSQGNPPALLDACTIALDLLPQLAWLGLPVSERHRLLTDAALVSRDSVAAALDADLPELAVEWLEQGRSIVWNQFLQLRSPVDDLRREYPVLAQQLQQISEELERAGSRRCGVSHQPEYSLATNSRSLEGEIQRHHDLALRREKLLGEIRSLPGFERFLLPKTIGQLASLAISGPVVYLTANRHRCDALIVMAELQGVIHVPLPGIQYGHMEVLRRILRELLEWNGLVIPRDVIRKLILSEDKNTSGHLLDLLLGDGNSTDDVDRAVKTKPQKLADYTPNDLFQWMLKYLWDDVVNPILQALGFSSPPSSADGMARIFWCPTGPFSFLPIHAAGIYNTTERGIKLSDFAISSYLPTLGSLASSRNELLDSPSKVRLLTVPQPSTDGFDKLYSVEDEIKTIAQLCPDSESSSVTLRKSDGTVEDVMEKLKKTDWVHFACHGVQDPKKPLDSGLCLADHRRLKLSDIIQLSRPQGGLAFLSACQTAQGEETLSEESVHLAAGMLLAGYGSVVGTMWAIKDDDAPKVARDVYEYLFRDSVPDATKSAAALHYATQRLRDSGAPFSSWVPYIHFGR